MGESGALQKGSSREVRRAECSELPGRFIPSTGIGMIRSWRVYAVGGTVMSASIGIPIVQTGWTMLHLPLLKIGVMEVINVEFKPKSHSSIRCMFEHQRHFNSIRTAGSPSLLRGETPRPTQYNKRPFSRKKESVSEDNHREHTAPP